MPFLEGSISSTTQRGENKPVTGTTQNKYYRNTIKIKTTTIPPITIEKWQNNVRQIMKLKINKGKSSSNK
jgi:hypothetical protein